VHDLTIRVLSSTADGLPERVRFTFASSLESNQLRWLVWQGTRLVPFEPPRVGRRVRLSPLAMVRALPP
jgi:hypothetical protein